MCCIEIHSVVTYVSADSQDFQSLERSMIHAYSVVNYMSICTISSKHIKIHLKIYRGIYISYLSRPNLILQNCSKSPKIDILLLAEIFSQDISTHYLTTDVY